MSAAQREDVARQQPVGDLRQLAGIRCRETLQVTPCSSQTTARSASSCSDIRCLAPTGRPAGFPDWPFGDLLALAHLLVQVIRPSHTQRIPTWLTIDLLVIFVSLVIIGLGMWIAPGDFSAGRFLI